MHALLLWWQGSGGPVIADAYAQDYAWVPSDLFLSVESDDRFAWVPVSSARKVER